MDDMQAIDKYEQLLKVIGGLSNLFSDSSIPYINYRAVENLYCYCFSADNLSRTDTAYDARIGNLGIGIKTFILSRLSSTEKVAEFDKLSDQLIGLSGMELAQQVSKFRNDRILLANSLYGISKAKYHIVGRRESSLLVFETDYSPIINEGLKVIKDDGKIIKFTDSQNEYSFNRAKSTLYRKFILPKDHWSFPVEILENPFELLMGLSEDTHLPKPNKTLTFGEDFVVLPLYSTLNKDKRVPEKSGLNQWNAGGRARTPGELYIPIPGELRDSFPDFFPEQSENVDLVTPTGEILPGKIAQQGGKALMTNPNDALSDWLLRKLFNLKERQLLTKEREDELGFNCVFIYNEGVNEEGKKRYKIDKAPYDSYEYYMHPDSIKPAGVDDSTK